jgi:hypothetical protein
MPCDVEGIFVPPDSIPPPKVELSCNDWSPFKGRLHFELAEFLYVRSQMPAGQINTLLDLWTASVLPYGGEAPFRNVMDLYETIDSSALGDIKWQSFKLKYEGSKPTDRIPSWMMKEFDVWFRDPHKIVHGLLANSDFVGKIDSAPYRMYNTAGEREYSNFMSGDWAWQQAVC